MIYIKRHNTLIKGFILVFIFAFLSETFALPVAIENTNYYLEYKFRKNSKKIQNAVLTAMSNINSYISFINNVPQNLQNILIKYIAKNIKQPNFKKYIAYKKLMNTRLSTLIKFQNKTKEINKCLKHLNQMSRALNLQLTELKNEIITKLALARKAYLNNDLSTMEILITQIKHLVNYHDKTVNKYMASISRLNISYNLPYGLTSKKVPRETKKIEPVSKKTCEKIYFENIYVKNRKDKAEDEGYIL